MLNNNIDIHNYFQRASIDKIILFANVYTKTKYYNINKELLRIEFFNEKELDQILTSLKKQNYKTLVYFDENKFINDVLNTKIHITNQTLVFNLARNGTGVAKKSLIPSFCDLMGIKYTGSNGYACSLARNKYHVSKLLEQHNLHGIPSYYYNEKKWLIDLLPPKNTEVIMKPLCESASRGITHKNILNTSNPKFEDIVNQYNNDINSPVIVQNFISGYEVKVPVFELNSVTAFLPIGVKIDESYLLEDKIITQELSYHYKYSNCSADLFLGKNLQLEICDCAVKIFNLIGMQNYGRIDCRITKSGEFYFYDFATMPYFTAHSELNFIIERNGSTQSDLFNLIFNSALKHKYNNR